MSRKMACLGARALAECGRISATTWVTVGVRPPSASGKGDAARDAVLASIDDPDDRSVERGLRDRGGSMWLRSADATGLRERHNYDAIEQGLRGHFRDLDHRLVAVEQLNHSASGAGGRCFDVGGQLDGVVQRDIANR
jgi:hypothetical protein